MFFHHLFWGGLFFGSAVKIMLVGFIIWLVVHSFSSNHNKIDNLPPESPLDILKKRYAKGEISKDQFEQMRKDME
jgi:putative membrane protein